MINTLLIFLLAFIQTDSYYLQDLKNSLIQKGNNITDSMAQSIQSMIKDTSDDCKNISDLSCFSQRVSLKIQAKYGKNWNVHTFGGGLKTLKGSTFSNQQWLSFTNQGKYPETQFAYYIYKPNSCAKFIIADQILRAYIKMKQQKQYWGSKMSNTLQQRVKSLIQEASKQSSTMEQNADYIKKKMGPGKWQVVIWDSDSMDYLDACIYQSYFGILLQFKTNMHQWSYYVGRMSLF